MDYIFHFDICAAILLFINLIFFFSRKHLWDRQSKLYCGMLVISFLCSMLDIGTIAIAGIAQQVPKWLVCGTNALYLSVFHSIPPLMLIYFWELVGELDTLKTFWKIVSWVPYAVMTGLIISSPWTGAVFTVDQNNVYSHGKYHYLLYVAAAMMFLLCVRIIIVYADSVDKHKRRAAKAFLWLVLAALVIQHFVPRLLLVQFGAALALMIMYVALQEPSSYVDQLTEAYNRAGMMQIIYDYFYREKHFALIACGIDDFKKVNGIFGDKHGDELLCSLSAYLSKRFDASPVARLGGDWFCVLLSGEHSDARLLEEIRDFPDSWEVHGAQTPVTCCRFALDSNDYASPSEMLLYLQYAQKAAKAEGPGTFMLVDNHAIERYKLEQEIKEVLEKAVRDRSFSVEFQPIVSTGEGGKTHSVEALARLRNTRLGDISPADFIPIAEKHGLICQIGDIVREKVFDFLAHNDIRAAGIDHVSINLSVIECMRRELCDRVTQEVDRLGIDPSTVCFEITESAAAMSYSVLSGNMERLAARGFTFALDDYGTGFSNLESILSLPFRVVKLDKSVLYAADRHKHSHLLRSLIAFFHSLDLEVVCEGVQTIEQDEYIHQCAAEYVQGFLYSSAMTPEEFVGYAGLGACVAE